MSRYTDATLFSLMASFWALNYVFLKFALPYEDPIYVLSLRIGVAAVITTIFLGRKAKWPSTLKLNFRIFTFSMINIVAFMTLWFTGENTVSAGLSAIIVYSYPLFNVLFSRLFLRETLSARIIAGLVVGFAGVVVTFSGSLLAGNGIGLAFLVLSAISWALGTSYYKKYLSRENVWTVNTFQYFYAFPVILLIALLTEPVSISGLSNTNFLLVGIYMGSFGTAAAYFIYLYLFRHYKASSISSFFFAVPALSLLFGFLIEGEVQSPMTLVGFLIISVGIYLGSGSVRKEEMNEP